MSSCVELCSGLNISPDTMKMLVESWLGKTFPGHNEAFAAADALGWEERNMFEERLFRVARNYMLCSCGSRKESSWAYDAQGIPLCRVCPSCRTKRLSVYREEILEGYGQQDVDEPIDGEEEQ